MESLTRYIAGRLAGLGFHPLALDLSRATGRAGQVILQQERCRVVVS